jgi:CBS domain-containing protein
MTKSDSELIVQLPIRVRRTELGANESEEACSVHCPLEKRTVTLDHCQACERFATSDFSPGFGPSLFCQVPTSVAGSPSLASNVDRSLEAVHVRAVMTPVVTCVDGELGLDEVAQLLEGRGLHSAPVVDSDGVLVGMLSKSDLVRGHARDLERSEGEVDRFPPDCLGLLVEDVMTRDVLRLRETDSLAEAARLFADRGFHQLPVVSKEEVVVGILSVLDLVRWMANQALERKD